MVSGPNRLSELGLGVLPIWDVFEAWGPAAQSTVERFAQVALELAGPSRGAASHLSLSGFLRCVADTHAAMDTSLSSWKSPRIHRFAMAPTTTAAWHHLKMTWACHWDDRVCGLVGAI